MIINLINGKSEIKHSFSNDKYVVNYARKNHSAIWSVSITMDFGTHEITSETSQWNEPTVHGSMRMLKEIAEQQND